MNPTSNIQHFFVNKTVFITGASGFIGKAIMEKLLRDCGDLHRIYVLLRPKHNMNAEARLVKVLESSVSPFS